MEEHWESGSTSHMFNNCGIIHIDKKKISEEEAIEIAINAGAKDCVKKDSYHEIITKKKIFIKLKQN